MCISLCCNLHYLCSQLYDKSLEISSFKTLEGADEFDLDAEADTTFALTDTASVTIIDPFDEYVACLKECFDFDAWSWWSLCSPSFP